MGLSGSVILFRFLDSLRSLEMTDESLEMTGESLEITAAVQPVPLPEVQPGGFRECDPQEC